MNVETQPAAAKSRSAICNILVLTDLSPRSEVALRYATTWARKLGAMLHIAYFIRPTSYALAWDVYGPVMEKVWEDGRAGLAAIDASAELKNVLHATYLNPGEIHDGLEELIAAQKVDLVILASAARTGLGKVLLGSTAESVFRTAPCPVLMLGPSAQLPKPARKPQTLLLAVDFGPATARAQGFAFALAQELHARLYLLHVLAGRGGNSVPPPSEIEAAERQLRALVPPEAESWCKPVPMVKTGEPAAEIVNAASQVGADLIVLGARPPPHLSVYTGWANAYTVLHEARCPVLTVREKEQSRP